MKFLISVILFAASLLLIATAEEKFSFTGYKLIRLYPKNDEQVKFINELEHIDNDVDIWGTVLVGDVKSIDIMLPPSVIDKYSKVFSQLNIEFEIVHDNIQELIDQESRSMEAKVDQNERYSIIYKYARYVEIMSYIEQIAADNSDIASTQNIGTTFQGRILKIIKLRKGNPTKSIWIDCGIHAREWVSPSSCVFNIARLIQELRNNDPEVVALFEKYDFHILPLHNPDGYEHSHTSFRLWRKNRKNYSNSLCYGTDLNRNYPAYWLSGGSSTNECSDVYAGPSSASELESRAVMAHINGQLKRWDAFLSFHSYGNWWLTPYGHTTTEVPPDYDLIMAAADAGVQAIKAYNGSVFVAGPTANLLYIATGSSADWAYSRGIRYSYVIELRPGPNTPDYTYGFMLPVDRMPLVANEAYIGTKAFLNHISKL